MFNPQIDEYSKMACEQQMEQHKKVFAGPVKRTQLKLAALMDFSW
jgi:hypothetical protein